MQNRLASRVVAFFATAIIIALGNCANCFAQGAVASWGSNSNGQLGDGSPLPHPQRNAPVSVAGPGGTGILVDIVFVAGGYAHSLAVKSDGTVWAWGAGMNLDLGIGASTVDYNYPVQVQDPSAPDGYLHDVKAVAAGYYYSIALKNDGTVWGWGLNSQGELGDGTNSNGGVPSQALIGPDGSAPLTDVTAISAGFGHTLALKSDGTVWAFGFNTYGEVGAGGSPQYLAVQVSGLPTIQAIAAGGYFSLALDTNGHVWAWGQNDVGTLGDCEPSNSPTPVEVLTGGPDTNCIGGLGGLITWPAVTTPGAPLAGITAIAANSDDGMAIDSSGKIWVWGGNSEGALAAGVVDYPYAPYANDSQLPPFGTSAALSVAALSNVVAISTGYEAGHAITSDGKVWGWGYDLYGGVGDNTVITTGPEAVTLPVRVLNASPITASGSLGVMASGWTHHLLIVDPNFVFSNGFDN